MTLRARRRRASLRALKRSTTTSLAQRRRLHQHDDVRAVARDEEQTQEARSPGYTKRNVGAMVFVSADTVHSEDEYVQVGSG